MAVDGIDPRTIRRAEPYLRTKAPGVSILERAFRFDVIRKCTQRTMSRAPPLEALAVGKNRPAAALLVCLGRGLASIKAGPSKEGVAVDITDWMNFVILSDNCTPVQLFPAAAERPFVSDFWAPPV
jgi:hypothetical protein